MLTVHLSFLFQVSQCYTTTINFYSSSSHTPLHSSREQVSIPRIEFILSLNSIQRISFIFFALKLSIDRSISLCATIQKKKKKKKRNNGKRGGNEKWRFSRKVGGKSRRTGQRRLHRSSPRETRSLALRNRSIPLITIEQESLWRARS